MIIISKNSNQSLILSLIINLIYKFFKVDFSFDNVFIPATERKRDDGFAASVRVLCIDTWCNSQHTPVIQQLMNSLASLSHLFSPPRSLSCSTFPPFSFLQHYEQPVCSEHLRESLTYSQPGETGALDYFIILGPNTAKSEGWLFE